MLKNRINRVFTKKLPAMTFLEVLAVMAILSILTFAAVTNFMPTISKAKAMEAQLQLEHIFTMEKNYFMINSRYSASFSDIGFEQNKLTTEGGTANYKIEVIDATNRGFKARATAITDFDADGTFSVWEVDQDKNIKEVTPD